MDSLNIMLNMEKLVTFIKTIIERPVVDTVIILLVLYFCGLLTSCKAVAPIISDNKVAAEGIVSKEKNVTRQTKWYFKPEGETSPIVE